MISTYVLLAAGWTLLSISRCLFVSGHGHLITPRSRNYFAYEAGRDDTTNSPPGLPPREYCSHCLNAKLATETCGRGAAQSYDPNPVDGWLDTEGNPMPWISQQTYVENQEILVSIELTTNHAGHAEVRACPLPDNEDAAVATQECFDSNPLTFVRDVCWGGPVDDVYPVRGYFSNNVMHHFIYKLPEGLIGDKVLLQWRYIAANGCIPPGYKDEERLGLDARGWLRGFTMADCNVDDQDPPQQVLDPTGGRGDGDPEQFWNCAEVSVLPVSTANPDPGPHAAGESICGSGVTPTPPVEPTPMTPPTSPSPPTSPVDPNTEGYCNWGPLGTGLSATCDGCVQGGNVCNAGAHQCESDCGGRWCTNNEDISPTCSSEETPPSPTPLSPSSPSSNFYCGTSWMNAKDLICKPLSEGGGPTGTGTPCANGNSTVCDMGSYCYADIICSTTPQPTNMPVVTPPTTSNPTTPTTQPVPPPSPSGPTGLEPITCPDGYESARWTWYISYPKCCADQDHYDPLASTEECEVYNGCAWDGDFAYVGNRPFSYVENTDIVAFFASNGETHPKKIIRVYSPAHDKTVDAIVLDTCGDEDCNGCCTENANTGGGYLVDMEENTVVRHFGALDEAHGLVCWKVLPDDEYDAGGYCSWSSCDGSAQGGWECNLNEYECTTTCGGGTWCPTIQSEPTEPPVIPPSTPSPVRSTLGPQDNPTPTTPSPVVTPTTNAPNTNAPVKSPTEPPVPSGGSGEPCCTWDLKSCSLDAWCNASEQNCKGSCGAPFWKDVSVCPADGVAKDGDCINGVCCPGLYCHAYSQWHKSCQVAAA